MHMHTARLLKSSCSLTELNLGSCSLGNGADVIRLLEALNANTTVTKLTLWLIHPGQCLSTIIMCIMVQAGVAQLWPGSCYMYTTPTHRITYYKLYFRKCEDNIIVI